MLTLPTIVERAETHYAGVSAEVMMPFGERIDPLMNEVEGHLRAAGGGELGLALFRYDVIDMPRLEVQFGFTTPAPIAGTERVKAGVLPAGRYATVTYFGHYDDLEAVTGVLIGWAKLKGIEWDSTMTPQGERFAARVEIYPNGPADEPDPAKWETQIFIKVRD